VNLLKILGNGLCGMNKLNFHSCAKDAICEDAMKYETILDKGIMPSEKVLDFPVDCNTLTGSVNL